MSGLMVVARVLVRVLGRGMLHGVEVAARCGVGGVSRRCCMRGGQLGSYLLWDSARSTTGVMWGAAFGASARSGRVAASVVVGALPVPSSVNSRALWCGSWVRGRCAYWGHGAK
jgi:hypothetical protein